MQYEQVQGSSVKVILAVAPEDLPIALITCPPGAPAIRGDGIWPRQAKVPFGFAMALQMTTIAGYGFERPVLYLTFTSSPGE